MDNVALTRALDEWFPGANNEIPGADPWLDRGPNISAPTWLVRPQRFPRVDGYVGAATTLSPVPAEKLPVSLTLKDQKQQQRDAAFGRRALIVADDAGEKASRKFLDAFPALEGKTVSLYWPLGSELDTKPLLRALHDRGVACALPVVEGKDRPLSFRRWTPETVLEPGAFNVLIPAKSADQVIPDLVITPMLAFDAAGFRLGYGGGFYDRTLGKLRKEGGCRAIGFAYAAQEIVKVVTDRFDQRLDSIITEKDVRTVK